MPTFALLRNLATMTRVGLLTPFSDATAYVTERLTDDDYWGRDWTQSRYKPPHPLNVLVALRTYGAGQGGRSRTRWEPVGRIVDALDAAFYKAFGAVEPTGLRTLIALDISASMAFTVAGTPLSCREAAAAMAMITARVEPRYEVVAFSARSLRHYGIKPVSITPGQRLDDVMDHVHSMPAGGTDCALPMLHALELEREVDLFVVLTDNETWAGRVHPIKALRLYRRKMNPEAALAVVGMTATDFSIADPRDPRMLDVVGFDTATPQAISAWVDSLA